MPEEFTESLWSDLKESEDALAMPARDGSRQKKMSFIRGIEQGAVSFSDEQQNG